MTKKISVRLDELEDEKLLFLYNLYNIEKGDQSTRFRNLLHAIYAEKMNLSETPTHSTTENDLLEILEGWDCAYRAVVHRFDKFLKRQVPFVHCSAVNTRRILGSNLIDIAVCRKCHDRGADSVFIAIPAPKKTEKPEPISKPEPVKKPVRRCAECGADISRAESWKTLCYSCWHKRQNPAWQGQKQPLKGSPADLRKKEADAIRRANEKMNTKNENETEE